MKAYPLIISYDPKQLTPAQVTTMYNSFKQVANTEILLVPNSLQVLNNLPIEQLEYLQTAIGNIIADKLN